jgi:Flp pilus assembly protein TadD
VSLAYAGRKAEAIRSAQRGVALMPLTEDAYNGPYVIHLLTRVYIITGDKERAVAELEPLLRVPYLLSPARLRIDPNFARLRGFPKFEKLLSGN